MPEKTFLIGICAVMLIQKCRNDCLVIVAAKKETYSQAMERLEKIVRQIDNNELDIDILSEKIKEANEIIAFCKDKLTKADREVEKLLQEKRLSEE